MHRTKKVFDEIKKFDISKWELTLYLIKHSISNAEASYSILRVNADEKLKRRLRGIVKGKIDQKNYTIQPYEFTSEDQDEQLLTIDTATTDFPKIQTEIAKGIKVPVAQNFSELLNSWAYVMHLQHEGKDLYALRKVSALSQAKKVKGLTAMFFQNHMLVDLDDKQVFTIDSQIDFFAYAETTFITNKKAFESALNFRTGMEASRDKLIDEISILKLFSDTTPFREVIASNMRLLRKVSAARNSAYYKDPTYMSNLITSNKIEKWGLTIDASGRIEVTDTNVELILTLLNNARLKSPINSEVFDAAVKVPVKT